MKNHLYVFFLSKILLLLLPAEASSGETTYPEEVHQLVIEKLHELRGQFGKEKKGDWGEWSPWTPCSRSCGTGVSTQRRECQALRNKIGSIPKADESSLKFNCVGRKKRFQLCNTQTCPQGLVDFRAEQCTSYNKTPFNNRIYTWEPFIDSSDSCTLNCRAVGLSFYATLNQSVIDGTPCGAFRPDGHTKLDRFCVEGSCMKVGCDGLLGSGRVVDSCGLCGGDNSSCRVISGIYTRPKLPYGYNLIATLPPGATNLSIYHLKPSNNYLALRELGGNYILNGPSGLNSSGSFEASGTIFTYSRPNSHGGDHLYSRGPTLHSLDIMLFFQNTNPGIRYEYRLPMSSGKVLSFQTRAGTSDTRWPSNVVYPGTLKHTTSNHRFGYARNPVESFYKPNGYISSPQLLADDPSYIDGVINPLFGFNSSYLLSKENNLPGYSFQPSGYPYEKDQNVSLNLNTFKKAIKSELAHTSGLYANNNNYRFSYPFSPANTHTQAWKHNLHNPISKSLYPQAVNTNYNPKNKLDTHYLNSYQPPVHQPSLKSGFQNAFINTNQNSLPLSTNQIGTNQPSYSISPNSIFYHHPKTSSGTRKSQLEYLEKKQQQEWNFIQNGKTLNKKPQKTSSEKTIKKHGSKKNFKNKNKNRFIWEAKGFTECTQPCGGGSQTSRIVCRKRKKGVIVPPHFCSNLSPPKQHVLTCNLKPCSPKWVPTSWGDCSVTCGLGVQFRKFVCKQRISPEKELLLLMEECGSEEPSLPRAQVCQRKDCDSPPSWDIGTWSKCSSECGLGTRRRNVTCTTARGILDEKFCMEAKPAEEEICDMGSCAVDTWFYSKWDETCKGPCGYGTQTRRLHCNSDGVADGESASPSCSKKDKPEDVRRCTSSKQCSGSWFEGPWNECDTQCGIGRQHRAVVCVLWRHGRYKVAKNEADCKGAGVRPADTRPCTVDCLAQWFTSEWSKCSSSCDGGIQRREIKCLDHNLEPSMECPSSTKPDSRQHCNTQPCNLRDLENKNEVFSAPPNDSTFNTNEKKLVKNYAYFEHGGTSFVQSTTDDGDTKLETQFLEDDENSSKIYKEMSKNASRKVLTEKNKLNSSNSLNSSNVPFRKTKEDRRIQSSGEVDLPLASGTCIDRMKNCFLVYKARLCKLKYYNKLCCKTCFTQL